MNEVFYSSRLPEWYNKELAKYPDILTREEEINLGNKIQNLVKAKKYGTHEHTNTVNELYFPKRNFAANHANKIITVHSPFLDKINSGMIGLYKAVLAFNPKFGDCIDAYSTTFIPNEVRICEYSYRKGLSASRTICSTANKFRKRWKKEEKDLGKKVSIKDAVDIYNKENSHKKSYQPFSVAVAENYIELLESKEINPSQLKKEEEEINMDTLRNKESLKEQKQRALIAGMIEEVKYLRGEILNDRELEIIEGRFGLPKSKTQTLKEIQTGPTKVQTLEELSKTYEITHERIRQIEFAALKKLRNAYNSLAYGF